MALPIIVEQVFTTEPKLLWEYLTSPLYMRQWFFENIPDFIPVVGFSTRFNVEAGERQFMHLWKILDVIEERRIVYDWRYQGYEGAGRVTFELLPCKTGTLLRLTNEGLETFSQDIPEFTRASCEGGWKCFIGESLTKFLENQ